MVEKEREKRRRGDRKVKVKGKGKGKREGKGKGADDMIHPSVAVIVSCASQVKAGRCGQSSVSRCLYAERSELLYRLRFNVVARWWDFLLFAPPRNEARALRVTLLLT